jgi:hypothetical protein
MNTLCDIDAPQAVVKPVVQGLFQRINLRRDAQAVQVVVPPRKETHIHGIDLAYTYFYECDKPWLAQ